MREIDIEYGNFDSCLKCSICTTVCPMMEVNPDYPGPKQAGPDGERYRLKDPAFYDFTLKYCLNCKRCEIACPSGVKVADIIQKARLRYANGGHPLRDILLSSTDVVGKAAVSTPVNVNRLLRSRAVHSLLNALEINGGGPLPRYGGSTFRKQFNKLNQKGFEHYVAYFHGCYVNYNDASLGLDLVRILNAAGYGVRLPEGEKCCGLPYISNGFRNIAQRYAQINMKAVSEALAGGCEAVLTTSPACTLTMRDEYPSLFQLDNSSIRTSIQMAVKWLYESLDSGRISLKFHPVKPCRVFYHTACHMQKLGWSSFSIGLLRQIPGIEVVVSEQRCCGIAGTFGLKKENSPYSMKIGRKLFDEIAGVAPDFVVCDCETCKWQIENSTPYKVVNPISVIASSIDASKGNTR